MEKNIQKQDQDRVQIGCHYFEKPMWQRFLAVPFVYLPILTTIPFMIIGIFFVRIHLKYTGAQNLKKYIDFVPDWVSHRYTYSNQITGLKSKVAQHSWKWFWIFNCKMYCPLSVALIKYGAYLVQIVEIWWCPFNHGKKCNYADSPIDKSFWHIYPDSLKELHPEDRDNPIWNKDS